MTVSEEEGKKNLERFGEMVVGRFDYAIKQLRRSVTEGDRESDIIFKKYLKNFSEDERLVISGQRAIEIFLHDLMAAIEESNVFRIEALSEGGEWFDLRTVSDGGLNVDQLYWIDEFSANERISEKLV